MSKNAYNIADRSDQELFDLCADDGVAYVPFFPLGSAFSTVNPVLEAPAVKETAKGCRSPRPSGIGLVVGSGSDGPADPRNVVAPPPGGEPCGGRLLLDDEASLSGSPRR